MLFELFWLQTLLDISGECSLVEAEIQSSDETLNDYVWHSTRVPF